MIRPDPLHPEVMLTGHDLDTHVAFVSRYYGITVDQVRYADDPKTVWLRHDYWNTWVQRRRDNARA